MCINCSSNGDEAEAHAAAAAAAEDAWQEQSGSSGLLARIQTAVSGFR